MGASGEAPPVQEKAREGRVSKQTIGYSEGRLSTQTIG